MSNLAGHFFIIGAQRSGTTLLYSLLADHPEICMARPLRPEPKYFIQTSIDKLNPQFYKANYFSHYTAEKWLGEKSTSYYELESVAEKIYRFNAASKIIFIARNPVQRALSNYYFSVQHGLETRTLADVFLNHVEPPKYQLNISVNPFDYIERGFYNRLLKPYIQYFGKENILILLFENMVQSQNLDLLSNFLELETRIPAGPMPVVNPSEKQRDKYFIDVIHKLNSYFNEANDEFANTFEIDLAAWRAGNEFNS